MKSPPHQSNISAIYLWIAHFLFILTVYGSLIPLRFEPLPLDVALERFRAIPLYDPRMVWALGDWLVNLAQYGTVAFAYMGALCAHRGRLLCLPAAFIVLTGGLATAVALEFLQIQFPPRTVSLNDILVESLGVVVGCLGWVVAGPAFTALLQKLVNARDHVELARQFLVVLVLAIIVASLVPFDFTLDPSILQARWDHGRIAFLVSSTGLISTAAHALLQFGVYFALGLLAAASSNRPRRGLVFPAALALGLAVPIELLQLISFTRWFLAADVLLAPIAAVAGWVAFRRIERGGTWTGRLGRLLANPPRSGFLVLSLGFAALLVVANWYPFAFTTDPARFVDSDPLLSDENTPVIGLRRLVFWPLVDYYWNSRYSAIDQFLRRTLSFAPLGALLALALSGRHRYTAILVVSSAVALIIELGQYFIPERHPGTTDLLIHVGGALMGAVVIRHVLMRLPSVPRFSSTSGSHARRAVAAAGPLPWRFPLVPSFQPPRLLETIDRWLLALARLPRGQRYAVVTIGAAVCMIGLIFLLARLVG